MSLIGWLLGLERVDSISSIDAALAAPWAKDRELLIALVCAGLVLLAGFFYVKRQNVEGGWKWLLVATRSLMLILALLTLANPILRITIEQIREPLFYVLIDATESMEIRDEITASEQSRLTAATGVSPTDAEQPARADYVRGWLRRGEDGPLQRLIDDAGVRLEFFTFGGQSSGQLRRIGGSEQGQFNAEQLAESLEPTGRVTSLGAALADVPQQIGSQYLSGVVVVSDFAHNAGEAPLGDSQSPATRIAAPIFSIGVGAADAIDLAATIQTDLKMKKAERTSIQVKLRQLGLDGQTATVKLIARPLEQQASGESAETVVGSREVTLHSNLMLVDFPYTPEQSGAFEFEATVQPAPGEVVTENNTARREVTIIDDFLRLLYVANEPTWEWRFVKEVFHRDPLVGMEGFRTFLNSSDPRVRQSNVLFTKTMTPPRREFFENDVLFLGDMPAETLTPRFCEMVREYVAQLGGGLVVITGPRFGPQALLDTPLAEMLPVVVSRDAALQDNRPFSLQLTADAARYPFMRLGDLPEENDRAWRNLGRIPWHNPVEAVREQAAVLAEHPTAVCRDGKTKQPLIAIRNYGRGEVVYLGFNEMWRLRRIYGEKHYRRFWSQLIYRLGMSHALGGDKRFNPTLQRQTYRAGEEVVLTVEAYDEDYEPLDEEDIGGDSLEGELIMPLEVAGPSATPIRVPLLRAGVFEIRVPVNAAGEYTIRVKDPITGESHSRRFQVTEVSAERRRATRDAEMQAELARATGGRHFDLADSQQLVDEIDAEPITESITRSHPLWSTPLWFLLMITAMLTEWTGRKWRRLA